MHHSFPEVGKLFSNNGSAEEQREILITKLKFISILSNFIYDGIYWNTILIRRWKWMWTNWLESLWQSQYCQCYNFDEFGINSENYELIWGCWFDRRSLANLLNGKCDGDIGQPAVWIRFNWIGINFMAWQCVVFVVWFLLAIGFTHTRQKIHYQIKEWNRKRKIDYQNTHTHSGRNETQNIWRYVVLVNLDVIAC